MSKLITAVGLAVSFALAGSAAFAGDCVVHYERVACKGQEAVSFKKCDKAKPADSAEACAAAALKSCDNDRLDITKYKAITARFDGQDLVGGYDASGNPDPTGPNFCAADRPDMNKCD